MQICFAGGVFTLEKKKTQGTKRTIYLYDVGCGLHKSAENPTTALQEIFELRAPQGVMRVFLTKVHEDRFTETSAENNPTHSLDFTGTIRSL